MTATDTRKKRTESKPIDLLTLPANELAEAWLNVSLAQSTNDGRPILRTMCVEVYDEHSVRLVATDSYKLFTSVVGPGVDINDLDTNPAQTLLVDPHPMLPAALKRMRRTKNVDVTLRLVPADWLGELDCGDITLRLKVGDGSTTATSHGYPSWRSLISDAAEAASNGNVALGCKVLPALAALAKGAPHTGIEMRCAGERKPVLFKLQADGVVPVHGLFMPVRMS
jgi:hypothetical protein